jgi:hypothetical protein
MNAKNSKGDELIFDGITELTKLTEFFKGKTGDF